jgi:hypothetical protein
VTDAGAAGAGAAGAVGTGFDAGNGSLTFAISVGGTRVVGTAFDGVSRQTARPIAHNINVSLRRTAS